MANSYKDIIITPNRANTADPKIEFRGGNTSVNTAITMQTYPTSNGTLSFEGSAGQLLSITNDLTGSIFSVNDVSGIPSIEVFANGQINMAQYGGNVVIGSNAVSFGNGVYVAANSNVGIGTTTPPSKLAIVTASSTGSTLGSWTNSHVTISPYAGSATGSAIGFGYNTSTDQAEIVAVAPGVSWRPLSIFSNGLNFNSIAGSVAVTINGSGQLGAAIDIRSPIYYDGNNTAFYADPDSTSQFNTIEAKTGSGFRTFINGSASIASQIYFGNAGNTRAWNWQLDENNDGALWSYNGTAWAKRFTVTQTGSVISSVDMRAPIFYDSNNTTYYVDPEIGTNLRGSIVLHDSGGASPLLDIRAATSSPWALRLYRSDLGGGAQMYARSASEWYHSAILTAAASMRSPIFYDEDNTAYYTDPNSLSLMASVRLSSGFDISTNDVYGSMRVIKNNNSASLNDGMFIGYGNSNSGLTRIYGGGATSGEFTKHSDHSSEAGSFRAPIFYDSANTAYYTDPADTSRFVRLILNNGDNLSWGAAYGAGVPTIAATTNTALYFYPTGSTAGTTFTMYGTYAIATGSMRAPIFYDSDNTAYYTDPAGTSNINAIDILGQLRAGYSLTRPASLNGSNYAARIGGNDVFCVINSLDGTASYAVGIQSMRTSDSVSFPLLLNPNGSNVTVGQNSDLNYKLGVNGIIFTNTSSRAPIFYDSDNTAYYTDPASTSNLAGVDINLIARIITGSIGTGNTTNGLVFDGNYTNGQYRHRFRKSDDSGGVPLWLDYAAGTANSYTALIKFGPNTADESALTVYGAGRFRKSQTAGSYTTAALWTESFDNTATGIAFHISGNVGKFLEMRTDQILYWNGQLNTDAMISPIYYDRDNTAYFIDGDGTSTLNGLIMKGAISSNVNGLRTVNPAGGSSVTSSTTITGAIKIKLPETVYPMLRFTVRVYTYDGLSFDIYCGGHTSTAQWYNTFAYMTTQNRSPLNVRFTGDGTNMYVMIGNLDTVWSYPQVFITEVQVGYSNYEYSRWDDGWVISFEESTYHTIAITHQVSPPTSSINNTSDAYAAIYYDSNNTAYRANPNGNSVFSSFNIGNNEVYFYESATNAVSIRTGSSAAYKYFTFDTSGNFSTLNGNIYSYRYYDQDNTSYYADPSTTSVMWETKSYYFTNIAAVSDNHPFGLYFGSDRSTTYAIYREPGAWDHPYPDLRIAFHTGIKMGANAGYNGIRFYTDYDMASQVMSINNAADGLGAANIFVNNSLVAASSLRAPIFYDTDDTGYYANPAGTSAFNSMYIYGGVGGGANNASYTHAAIELRESTFGGAQDDTWAIAPRISFHWSGRVASQIGMSSSGRITILNNPGTAVEAFECGNFYSPIFYDYNNTAYYIDPNTGSNVFGEFKVNQNTTGGIQLISTTGTQSLWVRTGYDGGTPTVSATNVQFQSSGSSSGTFTFYSGNTLALTITGDYAQGAGSLRAPIFYDSNDTAYFTDPNSRSRQATIDFGNVNYYIGAGDWGMRNTTPHGWVQFGPANTSHAHIYTDRSNFYFNAQIQLLGGSQINQTDIRSAIFYDFDNTGYYVDPNSTSRLNVLNLATVKITAGITSLTSAPIYMDSVSIGTTSSWMPMTHQRAVYDSGYVTHLNTGLYKNPSTWGSGSTGWYAAIGGNDSYPTQAWYLTFDAYIQNSLGYVSTSGSFRAPIFYDLDNTAYYVDPAASTSLRTVGDWRSNSSDWTGEFSGKIQYHANNWYFQAAGEWLFRRSDSAHAFRVEQSGFGTFLSSIRVGSGGASSDVYMGDSDEGERRLHCNGNRIGFLTQSDTWGSYCSDNGDWNTETISYALASSRSPIFYDYNNTAYLFDGDGTSRWNISSQDSNHVFNQCGVGIVGSYDSTKFQTVFAMGSSYNSNAAGTSLSGAYGLWWSYPSAGGPAANLSTHGLLCVVNGSTYAQLDASTRAVTDMRAPIFYDLNDAAYYVDPNSLSRMVLIRADAYGRAAHNTGHMRGGYNNIGASEGQTSPIYCIGSSYEPAATTLGSMYGIGFTSGGSFFPSGASGWGLYIADNGVARIHLSGASGDITATGNITAYASDRRLKTNIKPISNAIDKLMRINGVEFDWVDNIQEIGFIPQTMHETGVIAQEIQAVIPDAVKIAPFNQNATDISGIDNEYLTVDKEKIIPLLIEAIKEQQARINRLEETVNNLIGNK